MTDLAHADELYVEDKLTDSLHGSRHMHFWSAAEDSVEFTLEQRVTDLAPGDYRFSISIMGGDSDGMASFNMSLLQLVNDGIITEEDALEASDNPDSLRMNFEGIFLSADNGGIIGDRSI